MTEGRKTSILFVDDEQRVLDGIRRQFHFKRKEWDMRFAPSGADAIKMLEEKPSDIIISDMRMPMMDGAQLLAEVKEKWPESVRFILSGQTDQEQLLTVVGAAHQFLHKPCDPKLISHAVSRTRELAHTIEGTDLRNLILGIESLPVLSSSYSTLSQILEDGQSGADEIAQVIAKDIGLSAKLLQMVNSAFFGLPRQVRSVQEAVVIVGVQRLKDLALVSKIIDALEQDSAACPLIERLWRLSIDIGGAAARAAQNNGACEESQETARLAGTLALIGRALIVRVIPGKFAKACEVSASTGCTLTEAETVVIGVPQQAVGAYALGLWAFDDEVVECVVRQATPEMSRLEEGHPLRFVHTARTIDYHDPFADKLDPVADWVVPMGEGAARGGAA